MRRKPRKKTKESPTLKKKRNIDNMDVLPLEKPKKVPKIKSHYINNEKLLETLINYKKLVAEYKESPDTLTKPKIPDYVGTAILMIAERLASRPNFANYSYRDEMVSDGIENCLTYIDNFNPDKSKNPFAYITQIIYYAFLRRIQKEKKQSYIKMKMTQAMDDKGYFRELTRKSGVDETGNPYQDAFKISDSDIKFFEKQNLDKKARKEKNKKSNKSTLDEFLE